ncbi:MAG: glycosyltransferase [Syntrophotalea acetylenica]|nr:glycosyltransferase [Syntrophotalea acetylenica]
MKIAIATVRMLKGFGVDVVVDTQAKGLARKGHKVTVFTQFHDSSYFPGESYTIRKCGADEEFVIACRRGKFDVVIAHSSPFFEILPQVTPYTHTVAYEHGDPYPHLFAPNEAEIRRRNCEYKRTSVYPEVDATFAISYFIRRDIQWPQSAVIYNGIDHLESIAGDGDLRQQLGISSETMIFLCVGRLGQGESNYKGTDILLDFWEYIRPQGDFALVLIGTGTEEDSHQFKTAGIHVILNASIEELVTGYEGADAIVNFSKWEGFNLPLVEGVCAGKPALALDVVCHNEVTPLVFPDCIALAEYCLKEYPQNLQRDAELCNKKIGWSTWQRNIDALEKQLIELVADGAQKDRSSVGLLFAWSKLACLKALLKPAKKAKTRNEANPLPAPIVLPPLTTARYGGSNRKDIFPEPRVALSQRPHTEGLVSICVLTKDKPEFLLPCIKSLLEHTPQGQFEIIIGDTGSTDKKVLDFYKTLGPPCRVVYFDYYNFSQNNTALAELAEGEYVLFLNNDTEVQAGWLEALMEPMLFDQVGIVGPKLLFENGTIQHAGCEVFTRSPYRFVGWHPYASFEADYPAANVTRTMPGVTGACLLIRHELFDSVGGFDPDYLEECQDMDLCMQVRQQGYRVIYHPKVDVFHFENGTREVKESNPDRVKFRERWELFIESTIYSLPHQSQDWKPQLCITMAGKTELTLDEKKLIEQCLVKFPETAVTLKARTRQEAEVVLPQLPKSANSARCIAEDYEDNTHYDLVI